MNFANFLHSVDELMQSPLRQSGFRRTSAGNWLFCNSVEINVLSLQKHSAKNIVCANLCVHYSFLPKTGTEVAVNTDDIEFSDCELKFRLTSDSSLNDQWWPISIENAGEISELVYNRGKEIFDNYRVNGPITAIQVKDVEVGNSGLLSSLTKVRACLLLARMHEWLGNIDKCAEAARVGIKLAGIAVGPKKALKDILIKCEQAA